MESVVNAPRRTLLSRLPRIFAISPSHLYRLPTTTMIDKETQTSIRSSQDGDRRALELLICKHYHSLYKMTYKWCGNREMAQDVVQDVCIKVVRHLDNFRFQSSFSSWLYPIVINTATYQYRRAHRYRALPGDDDAPAELIDGGTAHDERLYAKQVLRRVQSLPEREKNAILLVFSEGMSHKEAAFSMGCKESTVSGYIHQARKKLAAFVADEECAYG